MDKCKRGRTLSNGSSAYAEGVKRCAESWGEETEEVERVLKEALESER